VGFEGIYSPLPFSPRTRITMPPVSHVAPQHQCTNMVQSLTANVGIV